MKMKNNVCNIDNYKIIHITGASGSGTSTLGAELSRRFGYAHLDTDDYFWVPTDPPFTLKRERDERLKLLEDDINANEKCVISGSLSGWGDSLIPRFELVIYVDTPAEIRLGRIKEREYRHFGNRIREGGDMYNEHLAFLKWAGEYDDGGLDMRSRAMHREWLKKLPCPFITVNGSRPMDEIIKYLENNCKKCLYSNNSL